MQTFNTLTEAVIAAINQIKYRGIISAHNITTTIRTNCNNNEWDIPSCVARPNALGIKYWINHDDVRRVIADLYVNRTLDTLGFVGRVFNGTFFEYSFISNSAPIIDVEADTDSIIDTTLSDYSYNVVDNIKSYLWNKADDDAGFVTMKQIQSALKVNGLKCSQIYTICNTLGYPMYAGPTDYCYSSYSVRVNQ